MKNAISLTLGNDVGNRNSKTANCCIENGITKLASNPMFQTNILEYEGSKYQVNVGGQKLPDNKFDDDIYFLQHLAGIGAEMSYRGIYEANMILAVGTPIARYGAEKKAYIQYLSRGDVYFIYEGKHFHIYIENVLVYPQCYAATLPKLKDMVGVEYVVDIGSWTVDILKIVNRVPDESNCTSEPNGIITLMKHIDDVCMRKMNTQIDEYMMREVLIHGDANIDQVYIDIIKECTAEYTKSIYRGLAENGINVKTTPITFVGGGAGLMKEYAGITSRNISYIEDVKSNAIGYEQLAKMYLANKRGA